MANREIQVGAYTKPMHGKFVEWLNALIQNYVNGFYDDAIKNIIMLSFIREHNVFMQELYSDEGKEPYGFVSVLPTDSTLGIFMIHSAETGEPYLYNKENMPNIMDFNSDGVLVRFFENVVIPLYDRDGLNTHEVFITFEEWYGIQVPMLNLRYVGTDTPFAKGFMDLPYEGKYSGTYTVVNKPLADLDKYSIKNISLSQIVVDIPILPNLNTRYIIPAGQAILIPVTEHTTSFVNRNRDQNNTEVKLIRA